MIQWKFEADEGKTRLFNHNGVQVYEGTEMTFRTAHALMRAFELMLAEESRRARKGLLTEIGAIRP